jgi:DNA-binding transcriptional MerR regulator
MEMTEEQRSPTQDSTATGLPDPGQDTDAHRVTDEWATLRDASAACGVPVSTLRKWYRADKIESRRDEDGRRLVRLEDVHRAREGRAPSTTLTLPAQDIWGLYQQAIQDLQVAKEEAAYLRGQVDQLRAEQEPDQVYPPSIEVEAPRPKWWARIWRGE